MNSKILPKTYNKYNFHKYTFCVFKEVPAEEISFDNAHFVSKTNSSYYFTENGVYRKSNHWGRVANCRWKLITLAETSKNRVKIGFATWKDFHSEKTNESSYILVYNHQNKTVDYTHYLETDSSSMRRNSSETMKRIKEIRNVIANKEWMNYYEIENPDEILNIIINKMIDTDLHFRTIIKNMKL